jgi:hypothetical protein
MNKMQAETRTQSVGLSSQQNASDIEFHFKVALI